MIANRVDRCRGVSAMRAFLGPSETIQARPNWPRASWLGVVTALLLSACTAPGVVSRPTTVAGAGGTSPTASVTATALPLEFDGVHAYESFLMPQIKIGIRPAGTPEVRATGDFILAQLKTAGWKTETQQFNFRGVPIRNVIGKTAEGQGPLIILGAHYDTRKLADQDKEHPDQPVMGANDGASGVAVLLELARTLDRSRLRSEVWLTFFDAEDNGEIPGCKVLPTPDCQPEPWPWSVGASYTAEHLAVKPSAVIIVDMIGDADQNIYYEQNSDQALEKDLWAIAARLGYGTQFIPKANWSLDDDHTPFLQKGLRAVDMIDFDYPYWHTTQDTADKVAPASLERVGRVLKVWLEGERR